MHRAWNIIIVLIGLLLAASKAGAQQTDNLRLRMIDAHIDTISLDTLSLIPGSIRLNTSSGTAVPSAAFIIDHASARLIWQRAELARQNLQESSFVITYRVYPFLFTQAVFHKEMKNTETEVQGNDFPVFYTYESASDDIFSFGGLNKSGNISRGLSFGNNQDIVVNSSLNLQLSGKLSEEVGILAAITDNNIPIQPDGNTQQIQEFDKVYIQLFTKRSKLTAGDFEFTRPESYFMNMYKKAQGGLLATEFDMPKTRSGKNAGLMKVSAGGAISKGKYARNTLAGIEGNQGPYKLTGANGETYIVILAGTEKVYVDGHLLTRGADQDYVIDYNMGEITFTPKNIITKDKRISIEFEYTDRNYSRSVFYAGTNYSYKKTAVRFNFFSEQDLKNQPLQQELDETEKILLHDIGDSLWQAVVPNIDSVAFSSSEVLYKMVDTLVGGVTFDSVFIYSTSPDSAHYRLGFSNVGHGNGNYIQVQSSANGRVFKWVAPQGGVPQGSYEPVILLVTPKKLQMFTLAAEQGFGKNTRAGIEVAMSHNDQNTFSPADVYDDAGYALQFSFVNRIPFNKDTLKSWALVSGVNFEYVQQYFTPIERFRSVEFTRDWNLSMLDYRADEHNPGLKIGVENKRNQFLTYQFRSFLKGSSYQAYRHHLDAAWDIRNFFVTFNGSYLTSDAAEQQSTYFKQKASLIKKLPWFVLGVSEEQENNALTLTLFDTLSPLSFAFEQYEAFIASHDTAKTRFNVSYKKRFDRIPLASSFTKATSADDAKAGLELTKDPRNMLKVTATYRRLVINDTLLTVQKPENTLLGRIEFFTRKIKRVITSNTFYEIGSGLEVKKEFTYVEVPAGQGVYSWTDYNQNGVKELNEFEIAAFSDQANYIRVFTPTNQYIKAYYSQFSEALNIEPAAVWSGKKGIRKFISRFMLQTTYRVDRKTNNENLLNAYNPFYSPVGDTGLLSLNSSLRSSLFFNRSHPKFGCELTYQDERNKTLLMNGFDARTHERISGRFRWNITRTFMLSGEYNNGHKTSISEYFPGRDFNVYYWSALPMLTFQPGNKFRMSISYKYADKANRGSIAGEKAMQHTAGAEIKYNILAKGSLFVKGSFISIAYNAEENSTLGFEMLEGFKSGNNGTWSVSYQRNLSEYLQLNLLYDGRQTPGNKTVHVGSVQLRAYF